MNRLKLLRGIAVVMLLIANGVATYALHQATDMLRSLTATCIQQNATIKAQQRTIDRLQGEVSRERDHAWTIRTSQPQL